MKKKVGPFHGNERGAVYVEFLIAFVTLLTMFFCIAELALLATANLLVRHSAMVAVRAAAVIRFPNPNSESPPGAFDVSAYHLEFVWPHLLIGFYQPTDTDKEYCKTHADDKDRCALTYWNTSNDFANRPKEVPLAAKRALYPWNDKILGNPQVSCTPDPLDMKTGANTNATCVVRVAYACIMPIAKQVLCKNGARWLRASASFPHQGAYYKPEFGF